MSFARDVYTATEEQTDFTITFPYISSTHVRVFQNGVEQTQGASAEWTIVSESTARFNTATDISAGDVIVIDRATSQDARLVDWETGTTLTEDDLDNDSLQAFYMAQEAIDKAATALGLDVSNLWDADGTRITEVGTPTAAADAVTKAYADGLVIAEGNVPPAEGVGTLLTSDGTNFSWAALEATSAQIENAAIDTQHLAADAVATTKIQDNAVTLAKLDHGTQGDTLYYGASGAPARLGAGTAGQFLKTQGAAANPVWAPPDLEVITSGTVSAAALDITDLSADYRAYLLVFDGLAPVLDGAELWSRTSDDNGSTFDSGATDYGHARFAFEASPTSGPGGSNGDAKILVDDGFGNAAGELKGGHVWILNPMDGSDPTIVQGAVSGLNATPSHQSTNFMGRRGVAEANNAIRFLFNSGNISAMNYTLYGLRAS